MREDSKGVVNIAIYAGRCPYILHSQGHINWVFCVSYNKASTLIASGSFDGSGNIRFMWHLWFLISSYRERSPMGRERWKVH